MPEVGFKWVENICQFIKGFIENYNEDSGKGLFLEVDIHYPEKLQDLQNDLPFLPERMKIEKFKNLQPTYIIKKEHVIHISNFKQGLNHGLVLKKCTESLTSKEEACFFQVDK